jgi:quercetin dioxygenase-like cupin family protein
VSTLDWNLPGYVNTPDATLWSATGQGVQLVRSRLRGGVSFPEHSHPQEQLTLVLAGCFEVTIDGDVHTLLPGQVLCILPNVPHAGRTPSQETTIVEAFSPTRPDLDQDAEFARDDGLESGGESAR